MKEQRKNRIATIISLYRHPSIILQLSSFFSSVAERKITLFHRCGDLWRIQSIAHTRLTWKRVKNGSCPLLYFRLAYLSPSVAYYAGWWFIGASRSLTSDLWMKIRARVAWATRRTATREIDRHYYSRCLVNMSIMLPRDIRYQEKRSQLRSLSCMLLSVVIVLTRFHFFFFLFFLFLVITDTGKIKSGFVRFKNCDDVERCNLLEIQFTLIYSLALAWVWWLFEKVLEGLDFFFFMFLNIISYF